ncbi:DUF86 domain-containing protein [bacterium]|nr:DUF86 domain-containing protein [bacterium]
MSSRRWEDRIQGIFDAIHEIQSFSKGMSFDDFKADPKTLKAVIADLSILGEVACFVPEKIAESRPDVPWAKMRGIRNRIIHGSFCVDPIILWDTIRNELPSILPSLERLLAGTNPSQPYPES